MFPQWIEIDSCSQVFAQKCVCVWVGGEGLLVTIDEREMRQKNYGSGKELEVGKGEGEKVKRSQQRRTRRESEGERENDYFIIKPSVMWAAATTQTSSLCGAVGVCLSAYHLLFAFTLCRAFVLKKSHFCAPIFPRMHTAKRKMDV